MNKEACERKLKTETTTETGKSSESYIMKYAENQTPPTMPSFVCLFTSMGINFEREKIGRYLWET